VLFLKASLWDFGAQSDRQKKRILAHNLTVRKKTSRDGSTQILKKNPVEPAQLDFFANFSSTLFFSSLFLS